MTDTSPPDSSQQQSAQQNPVDADATRGDATDLGDITDRAGPRFPDASLDGDGDRVDYFRFTLTEAKEVALGLRRQFAIRANGGHTMKATYALFAGMLLCLATQARARPQQIIDVGMTVGNNFGLNNGPPFHGTERGRGFRRD